MSTNNALVICGKNERLGNLHGSMGQHRLRTSQGQDPHGETEWQIWMESGRRTLSVQTEILVSPDKVTHIVYKLLDNTFLKFEAETWHQTTRIFIGSSHMGYIAKRRYFTDPCHIISVGIVCCFVHICMTQMVHHMHC